MVHIQRGDERQYLPQGIAQKDFSGEYAAMFNQGVNSAVTITQKANESTLANNQIDLSTKFLAKNNEINTKYQADPTNPERENELQQAFDSMAAQYKINPVCQAQWNNIKNDVYNKYKTYNAQWQEKQQQTNIQINLKNGYESLVNQISTLGLNGAGVDEVRLVYANGIEGLRNGATAGLGEVIVNDFLKSSTHDCMATYVSALALNNPLAAQELLQNESVRNDLDNAETIEKLENYIAQSLNNQSKKTAVNELCNVLRNMKSEDADRILDGEADLNQVMKFIETNKKLPEGSKDLILGIYGIGQKSKYYYDKDKKIITSQPANSSNSSGSSSLNGSDVKLSAYGKASVAEVLENDLHNLISFASNDEFVVDKKNIKTPQQAAEAQSYSVGIMQRAAMLQGQIDSAYAAKSIDKSTRKKYMNSYIAPVVDYVEKNLSQLDEKSGVKGTVGHKLGYGMIKQHYPTKGLKGEQLREVQRQKLFAQNYYLDELNKIKSKFNMNSIYDIENLSSSQQQEIYKTASENALKRAKRWTDRPEYYFAKEYPQAYAAPFLMLGQKQSLEINRTVAAEVFKKEFEQNGISKLELDDYANKRISREIQQQVNRNKYNAGSMLSRDMEISTPDPKTYWELEKRLKAMGYTIDEFAKFAANQGYVSSRFNGWDWRKGYMSQGHIQAYRDLRRAAHLNKN